MVVIVLVRFGVLKKEEKKKDLDGMSISVLFHPYVYMSETGPYKLVVMTDW